MIEQLLDLTNYATETRVARRKGKGGSKMGFNTKEELDNFIKTSTTTWPYKLMYIVDDSAAVVAHLPFMKDYTRYYDDEYFYKYFNITDDERKIIEDFIKKHYRPINRIKNFYKTF